MTTETVATVPFPRTRWQAGMVHLLASATVGLLILALIRFVWYPEVLFYIAGGASLATLIIGCDVVIGPLLTTLVFKRGKKTLKLDLSIILILQIAAMVYGCYIMYMARPAVLIAAGDRIYAIGYNQIDPADWQKAPPNVVVSAGRPVQYAVLKPFDAVLRSRLVETLIETGKDQQMLPEQYRAYADGRDELLAASRLDAEGRRYVPLVARNGDGMAYLDEKGDLKQMQEGDPWKTANPTP